jgi:hypothetical protein
MWKYIANMQSSSLRYILVILDYTICWKFLSMGAVFLISRLILFHTQSFYWLLPRILKQWSNNSHFLELSHDMLPILYLEWVSIPSGIKLSSYCQNSSFLIGSFQCVKVIVLPTCLSFFFFIDSCFIRKKLFVSFVISFSFVVYY